MHRVHKNRIAQLKSYGKNILIINYDSISDPNFFYYTGMNVDYGALWIPAKGPVKIFMSKMDVKKHAGTTGTYNIFKSVKDHINGKKVYGNFSSLPMSLGSKLHGIRDASHILSEIRSIKSKQEIKTMQENAEITQKILKKIKVMERTEESVRNEIDDAFRKAGGVPSYDTIVAGGSNTKMPHHIPTKNKMKGVAYIDAGIRRNGYVSDITRAYVTPQYQRILDLLLDSIKAVEDVMGPGVPITDLDIICRKVLNKYSKNFIHALGHGIGLEVHEDPIISSHNKDILKEGMTITIEPGIYTNRFGLRVENDYVITKGGFKRFSKTLN